MRSVVPRVSTPVDSIPLKKGASPCGRPVRVYVVIPVHNRLDFTRTCLTSLQRQSYPNITVIVIDDGSTDGTAEAIVEEFPDVIVLSGDGNLWWTGATNLGISWVLDRCGPEDFALTMNNDTMVSPDYLIALVDTAKDKAPALVGSVAIDARDADTITDGGPRLKWTTAKRWSENAGRSLKECLAEGVATTEPDLLPGRSTLIPTECFRDIGLLDARLLPHYGADYELSRRAALAGYRLVMSYRAPVFSHVEATGLSTRNGRLPWSMLVGMFFSRRSPACLLFRWRFARLAAPRGALMPFIVLDTIRVIMGAFIDQVRST